MNIWLINHYAVPEEYHPLLRTTNFAKYLMRLGHDVTIFAASSVHNSQVNLIQNGALYKEECVNGIHYVYARCHSYEGNGLGRISNMFEFAFRLESVCKEFSKPDVVMASSATPLACMSGLRIAKKYGAKAIAEITDLWPESFVAYGLISKYNPILIPMYKYEKKMYECADKIIFSQEGAYDYIRERGWGRDIPESKVYFLNNGVDLEIFDYNNLHYRVEDKDLVDEEIFKVVYTGSIRMVNRLGKLLDIAKRIENPKIKFLIWGKGDDLSSLEKRLDDENIRNVVFKGHVDKKYVPYITSHADLNIVHNNATSIWRFGPSLNKMFDYLAAGKMILTDFPCNYNPVTVCGGGVEISNPTDEGIARMIDEIAQMDRKLYSQYCQSARKGAEQYDFKNLTKKLLTIMTEA